jgi:hypothetical protein
MQLTKAEVDKLSKLLAEPIDWNSPEVALEVLKEVYLSGKSSANSSFNRSIVVSRHWDNPNILVEYKEEGIFLSMDAPAFVSAISAQSAHPLKIWTRAKQKSEALKAMVVVVEEMKIATALNPPPIR